MSPASRGVAPEPRTHPATAALTVSTEGPQEAVDHLDGAEDHLDPSYHQQDGEEGQIPGDHIDGLQALAPQGLVAEVIPAGDEVGGDIGEERAVP